MEFKPSSSSNTSAANRKPYAKPMIERVHLVLGEAVLGVGCKTTSDSSTGFKAQLMEPCWESPIDLCNESGS